MNYNLGRESKLKGKSTIDELFKNGESIRKGALRFIYMPSKLGSIHKIGFVVPKRYVKKAVDRNRIKRLMRESYRLHQNELNLPESAIINGMFVYQSSRIPELKSLNRLIKSQIKVLNKP